MSSVRRLASLARGFAAAAKPGPYLARGYAVCTSGPVASPPKGGLNDQFIPDSLKGRGSSQFRGVSWAENNNKWRAKCKGKHLGLHTTEEDAARAYNNYVKDGVVPGPPIFSSQFTGVSWDKARGKWRADCKGKKLGRHTTEEAAAHAYNVEAERLGRPINVIPPAEAAGAGAGPGTGVVGAGVGAKPQN